MAQCAVTNQIFGACPNKCAAKDATTITLMVEGNSVSLRVPVCETHLPTLLRMDSDYYRGAKVLLNIKEGK